MRARQGRDSRRRPWQRALPQPRNAACDGSFGNAAGPLRRPAIPGRTPPGRVRRGGSAPGSRQPLPPPLATLASPYVDAGFVPPPAPLPALSSTLMLPAI